MDKPYYPNDPIASIEKLAKTLGTSPQKLIAISEKAEDSYQEYTLRKTNRIVFEPHYELKKLQKRINSRIFEKIEFPDYLQGGIKSESKKDYVQNATIHAGKRTLISLDIKNFYPNIKRDKVFDIYKNFFRLPDDVSEVLTKLTTFRNSVPQGGCTSSYLANLIFYNSEYRLYSSFKGKEIAYSRLLDDVTLSSDKLLTNDACSDLIRDVAGLFRKQELRVNNKKTKIEYRGSNNQGFTVTGLWVEHSSPKIRRKERRYIRQLVYNCELQYAASKTSSTYHDLWNKTSGKVAKLSRLNHKQALDLRERLGKILPEYDDHEEKKLTLLVYKSLKIPKNQHQRVGVIKNYNRLMYRLGILARSNKQKSKFFKSELRKHFSGVPTIDRFWHG